MTELAHDGFDAPESAKPSSLREVEAKFGADEIFFSLTNERGIIQAGNEVFRRVSEFEWDDLIGAPHKVVRHSDMPKGVFHYFWETLKQGFPIGAYVKNRAKSGAYYWVFAVATPTDDGFCSVRIKPLSDTLQTVQTLYADLRAFEAAGASPAESAARLLAMLKEAGYENYEHFQSRSLADELQHRAEVTGTRLDMIASRYITTAQWVKELTEEAQEVRRTLKSIRDVPLNMRVIASRLEADGKPIGAIADNYDSLAEEMAAWVNNLLENENGIFARMRRVFIRARFAALVSSLQNEQVKAFFDAEPNDHFDINDQAKMLKGQYDEAQGRVSSILGLVRKDTVHLERSVLDMKRFLTGLSSTRMMCKIERATLNERGSSLDGIVEQLDDCQREIEKRLMRISELNAGIQNNAAIIAAATEKA